MEESKQFNNGLPEGWKLVSLGDICVDPQYGWTTSADKNGRGIKLLRTTDISKGKVDWSTVPECEREPEDVTKYLLSPWDILVSRAGSVGISYVVKECPKAVFASYLIRFRPLAPNLSDYIGYFLKSPQYWDAIAEETAGIAIPNVNASKLKKLRIPLPSAEEQKRIVAKIEELLPKVNAVRERLIRVKEIMRRFRQSVLFAACSGSLTYGLRYERNGVNSVISGSIQDENKHNLAGSEMTYELFHLPDNWLWLKIKDVGDAKGGKRLPKGSRLVKEDTGFPYIKAGNLKNGTVIHEGLEYLVPEVKRKIGRYTVNSGDVYITIVGACIGDAGVIPENLDGANLTENAAKICNLNGVDSRYLAFWLRSPFCQEYIRKTILSAAQGKLALSRIRNLPLAKPPLGEQEEIGRRTEQLFSWADRVEKRVEVELSRTEKITQAILAKAFRGELVAIEGELGNAGKISQPG